MRDELGWRVFRDAQAMAEACVEAILYTAEQAIAERGVFHFVTAGGTTPLLVYRLLAKLPESASNWSAWQIYVGDERVLPSDHSERNSGMLQQAWLNQGWVPPQNWHFMPTELGCQLAAEVYRELLERVGNFDLTLLGMGEDGHTASLFPSHVYPTDQNVVKELNSPKPPSERVSLSYARLNASDRIIKLITGANKSQALQAWLAGETLPINQVAGKATDVWLDQAAWEEVKAE